MRMRELHSRDNRARDAKTELVDGPSCLKTPTEASKGCLEGLWLFGGSRAEPWILVARSREGLIGTKEQ